MNTFKLWLRARKIYLAKKVFNYLYRDSTSGMSEIIENSINQRTVANIMNWLDHKRMLHCVYCPITEELRNHVMGKMCPRHFEMASRPATKAPLLKKELSVV